MINTLKANKKVIFISDMYLSADFAKRKFGNESKPHASWMPEVGDTVLLRRPP